MVPAISLHIQLPPVSSYGVTTSLVVDYANTGSTAVPAPVLFLSATNANLWLPSDPAGSDTTLQLLATGPSGPAGTLAAGASGTIVVNYASTSSTASSLSFNVGPIATGQTINWASAESTMQPSTISATAWSAIFANFTTNVGSTTESYQATLDADATYLAQFGIHTNDVSQLVAYEVNKAADSLAAPTLSDNIDATLPTPGNVSLTFDRWFAPGVAPRYQSGPLGLGWTDNWAITASADTSGDVTINDAGELRIFTLQSNGTYAGEVGDHGVLKAVSGGGYQLLDTNGITSVFNADGTLGYEQDSNGNRITASYASGLLAKLTDSNGEFLAFSYSSGLLTKITDSTGETSTYSYNSAGPLLTSESDEFGTITYSYITGQGAAAQNALASITYANGSHDYFAYDSEGRLIDVHEDGNLENESISYAAAGGYSTTDANGNKTTVLYDDNGLVREVIDPLKNVTTYAYDASGNLTAVNAPLGASYAYSYDSNGNLVSATDPLGLTTVFTYNADNDLTSTTDARGESTSFAYDSHDNLLSITYADGTVKQFNNYNPEGEAAQYVNANGQAIAITYNSQGLPSSEKFADGSSYSYTYDAHGNLLTATSSAGTIKFEYQATGNPDLLTEVLYPNGQYLKFSYNLIGQRTKSVDQTGFTVNYQYDTLGRLDELTDGSGTLVVRYTYDSTGNLTQEDMGNGTRTTYAFNADDEVISISNYAPDHITLNAFDHYTYDARGDVLTDTSQDGEWVYTYDVDGELVHAVFTPNSVDPDGLTAQNLQYTYDAAGNRVSSTAGGVTTTYAVNAVNEMTSSTTAGAVTTFQYDKDGNLIGQAVGAATTTYSYDSLDELTGISAPGQSESFTYDPLGDRSSQTINGTTTEFLNDPLSQVNLASSYTGSGSLIDHFTTGFTLVSQTTAAGASGYYNFNLTGDTIGISGSSGNYVNKYSYLPFGSVATSTTALANPFTFVGQYGVTQEGSSLFAMGARSYSATTGQFLSNDPLGLGGLDTNLRRYVNNDPVGLVDFTGESPWSVKGSTLPSGKQPNGKTLATYGDTHFEIPAFQNGFNNFSFVNRYNTTLDLAQIKKAGFDPREVHDHEHLHTVYQDLYGRTLGPGSDGTAEEIWVLQHYLDPKNGARHITKKYQQFQAKKLADLLSGKYKYPSGNDSEMTDNTDPSPNTDNTPIEGTPVTLDVGEWEGQGTPTATTVFNEIGGQGYDVTVDDTADEQGTNNYILYATVTFPESEEYGVTTTVNGNDVVEDPGHEAILVYDAPLIVTPVDFSVPAGGTYSGPVATFTDLNSFGADGDYSAWTEQQGSGTEVPATIVPSGGNSYTVMATLSYEYYNPGSTDVLVGAWDNDTPFNPQGGGVVTDQVEVTGTDVGGEGYSTSVSGQIIQASANQSYDPPLAVVTTTDPNITNASQVHVSTGTPSNNSSPYPLVTGVYISRLSSGATQIVIDGVVSAINPGAGPVVAAPLEIQLAGEPALTAQIVVNETANDFVANPELVSATAGQPALNLEVATIGGPLNGSYSATINWGGGDTSIGQITPIGGDQFAVFGTKPHAYTSAGTSTIIVSVTGPGAGGSATTSVSDLVMVLPPASAISHVSGAGTYLSSGTLSATVTAAGTPLPGKTVYFELSIGSSAHYVGSATTNSAGVATLPGVTLAGFGAGTTTGAVFAVFDGDSGHSASDAFGPLVVGAATPVINWPAPASIVPGTVLGPGQLNAQAIVGGVAIPGTFTYSPAPGTALGLGLNQTLSVHFTPTDSVDFLPAMGSVTINVIPKPVTVTSLSLATGTLGSGKKAKKQAVLQVQFSGPLNLSGVSNRGAYTLYSGTTKKGKTVFKTRLKITAAVYNASARTVQLFTSQKLSLAHPLELQIATGALIDSYGRALDGDFNGAAGGVFTGTLAKSGAILVR